MTSISDQPISNHETAEKVAAILQRNDASTPEKSNFQEMIRKSYQEKADLYNESIGHLNSLDGIDCPLCKNKGFSEKVVEGFRGSPASVLVECACMKRRRSLKALQNSGLSGSVETLTLERFETQEDWQKRIKTYAERYLAEQGGRWFFIGGAVGCGKTHICTAICGELLKQNLSVKYMSWSEESVKLKGKVNDDNYENLIQCYKDCDVLYIDDFFKTRRNRNGDVQVPSDADVKLAYQIINYRYVAKKKTIISSEWLIDELMDFDEATSSRIYEMSKGSILNINRSKERNYRRKLAV